VIPLAPLLAEHAHGFAGAGFWSWMVWAVVCGFSVWAIWGAVRATFRPGEDDPRHVKREVLEDDVPFRGSPPAATGGAATGGRS
jgi:hypothetical protein